MSRELHIRTMTPGEIGLAIEWAAREGWNPGLHDGECFGAADPGGFLVGLLDDEPVATISLVRYGADFAFLGFYIVSPGHRGHGYGLRIWNAAIERGAGRLIGLDGVVAQQANYRKSGFVLAYRNIRQGVRAEPSTAPERGIVPLAGVDFSEILASDRVLFPAQRRAFLECWISHPGHVALGQVENGRLGGFGVIRRCRSGWKIGPLYADRPAVAESLFMALQARAEPGGSVFLDTPEVNADALALARHHGMQPVFETARMYAGPAPELPLHRLYGVTSFELG